MKGLLRLQALPLTQEQLAEQLHVSQQYISEILSSGEISRAVAQDVAKHLGIGYEDLVDHGRTEPSPNAPSKPVVRIGDMPTYVTTLDAARADADLWQSLPEWCWKQTATFMTTEPPVQLTKIYLLDLARAAFNGATPERRRLNEGRDAASRLDTGNDLGTEREIKDRFSPTPPSDSRLPTRRGGK